MAEIKFMTGSTYIPFRENADIVWKNLLAGRPLFEGRLPSLHIPDQA